MIRGVFQMPSPIDERIVALLREAGANFACSVPDGMTTGVLELIEKEGIDHVPVTREEEGVGVCAGASLSGRKPVLFMQNSGLGNSTNALASLTMFYEMPLLLMVAHRGTKGEKIAAQIPMGKATPMLLDILGIKWATVARRSQLQTIRRLAREAFSKNRVRAVLFREGLWNEKN
jgi:sulfopyruvate decarboxylase subunit alpha